MDDSTPGRRFDAQLVALARAQDDGLIDGIGLSNIATDHLRRALDQVGGRLRPESLQPRGAGLTRPPPRVHGSRNRARSLLSAGSVPRRSGRDSEQPAVGERARRGHAGQVALAWLLDLAANVLLIPGTRTRRHPAQNVGSAAVHLDEAARTVLGRRFPVRPTAERGGAAA
jgi:pyridoxine 4-dehydrogenase